MTYDLRPLTSVAGQKSYYILDGDLACTSDVTEPSFSYTWNFCSLVTPESVPGACANVGKQGVALQYLEAGANSFCYIIGRYEATQQDNEYKLIDLSDPSKGVSIIYPTGERCSTDANGLSRSAIIDVECANTAAVTLSAVSDKPCQYHLKMKSWHGCPNTCPVNAGGLCNNHGHCGYDKTSKAAYCYCNQGW